MHEIGYKNCRLKIQCISLNRIDSAASEQGKSSLGLLKELSVGSLCILCTPCSYTLCWLDESALNHLFEGKKSGRAFFKNFHRAVMQS